MLNRYVRCDARFRQCFVLREEGFQVFVGVGRMGKANRHRGARNRVGRQLNQPEAVVLDLELPGVSGFDLLTQFKRRRPGCVVIVLTTYAYPEFRDNALRLGADYFFAKAMEFERVTEVLSALVASPRGQPVKSKPEEKKP